MLPTIRPGTILLMNRLAYGFRLPFQKGYALRWSAPAPGDIVVFPSPDGVLAVKRVGDADAARFMALGDNAGESYDSRQYGPIRVDSVIGNIVGVK